MMGTAGGIVQSQLDGDWRLRRERGGVSAGSLPPKRKVGELPRGAVRDS